VTLRLDYRTLIEPVAARALRDPDYPSLVLIGEDGSEESVSAAQFLANAADYAAVLRAAGIRPRDIVILVMRHSKELLSAFWGALYLGAIPSIFPFLSEKLDRSLYVRQVRILVAHCRARAVIAFPEFKPDLVALLEGVDCQVFGTDEVPRRSADESEPRPHEATPETIALLQHSSGSTGLQKGVALAHRAILNQVRSYGRAVALSESDVIVSWMPLYHDGGLIAGCVMPLVAGVRLVLISPFHWVRDPKVLFQAVHRYRGTLTWLPNFAYNHCARNVRERDLMGVDLSRWRVVNAAEPVRWDSHRLFLERFGRYGLKESALAVAYGMAEATLFVTATPIDESPQVDWVEIRALQEERRALPAAPEAAGSTPMTSCGVPIEGAEIRIVDDLGRSLPERRVGEIVVRAECLFSGYYLRPDLDAKVLRDGWYFTGDMGYLAGGQLYVSGRKDDLIIVGGKNIYPGDLEAIADEVPGVRPGRAVAFGVPDPRLGTEAVVMVCELGASTGRNEIPRIESELRRRIAQETEVTLHDVRLMDGRWLIKTSSGKLARAANREKYLLERGQL
jgi:acyl-CoA synthetase (AMP-forming)/AMP-acid ligase II